MNTVGSYFKSLSILHAALCAGAGISIVVLRFANPNKLPAEDSQLYFIIGVVIAALNLILSRVMLFRIASPAQQEPSLAQKLNLFRSGFIVQMALLEGAVFVNIILWYIGGDTFNLGAALGMAFLMVFRRPARNLVQGLVFNPNEDSRIILNDDTQI